MSQKQNKDKTKQESFFTMKRFCFQKLYCYILLLFSIAFFILKISCIFIVFLMINIQFSGRAYWLHPLEIRIIMYIEFSLKFMPFFLIILSIFLLKTVKIGQRIDLTGYSHCTTYIQKKYKKVFQLSLQDFFIQYITISSQKDGENLVLLLLKSRFE